MISPRFILSAWIIFSVILYPAYSFAQIGPQQNFTVKYLIEPTERKSVILNLKEDIKRSKLKYSISNCKLVIAYDEPVEGHDGGFGAV
jgi:hypothetical protein